MAGEVTGTHLAGLARRERERADRAGYERQPGHRPVLVLTRDSAMGYLGRVSVAPITSTIRGVPSEVALGSEDGMKQPCAVNLHNVVTVSQEHVGRRVCRLDARRMRDVCDVLGFALGCGG